MRCRLKYSRFLNHWEGVDIEKPSLEGVLEAGFINPFDGYKNS